jgi:hypothetical protein
MMEGLRAYIDEGRAPGQFLTAIICNDLRGAVDRADNENLANIAAFVGYLYNEAPSACWGSVEKMDAWLDKKWFERQRANR